MIKECIGNIYCTLPAYIYMMSENNTNNQFKNITIPIKQFKQQIPTLIQESDSSSQRTSQSLNINTKDKFYIVFF